MQKEYLQEQVIHARENMEKHYTILDTVNTEADDDG